MEKTILVTGKDTFLGNEIALFFLNQGHKTAVSMAPRQDGYPTVEEDRRLLLFPWNRRSAISAKNFTLQAKHDLGALDEAWLIFSPEYESVSFLEMSTSELEDSLDQQVKGFLFLAKELLALQASNPHLKIHFVLFDEDKDFLPPLAALQYQGLRAFVSVLLAQAKKKNLPVWAFENLNGTTEAFARFILSTTWEMNPKNPTHGKWQLHNAKKTIFNQLFPKKD